MLQDFREKGNEAPLSLLKTQPLFTLPTQKELVVRVHMFNLQEMQQIWAHNSPMQCSSLQELQAGRS